MRGSAHISHRIAHVSDSAGVPVIDEKCTRARGRASNHEFDRSWRQVSARVKESAEMEVVWSKTRALYWAPCYNLSNSEQSRAKTGDIRRHARGIEYVPASGEKKKNAPSFFLSFSLLEKKKGKKGVCVGDETTRAYNHSLGSTFSGKRKMRKFYLSPEDRAWKIGIARLRRERAAPLVASTDRY